MGWCAWAATVMAVAVAPWFFGAWEMWWFWLFTALIAIGIMALGLRLVAGSFPEEDPSVRRSLWILGTAVPFLVYAVVRGLSSPVFMDAERSVLLHISGVAVAAMVAFGMQPRQRRLLFALLFLSLAAMAVYGIANHILAGSRLVLWRPSYEQYAGRATGPYFCPDHFAGAMELLFCMSAGLLLDRAGRGMAVRVVAGAAALLAATGVLLSKSRGAGMTLIVIGACILVWGFAQWPRGVRWHWRVIAVSAALLAGMAALQAFPAYKERFVTYEGLHQVRAGGDAPVTAEILDRLWRSCRGQMFGGAWRAWKTSPWTGIGAGMHQHLWPRFAATPDGDAERGIWPTMTNEDFHSFEVHSDWLQLLEEYGLAGLILFLVPFMVLVLHLRRGIRLESRNWRDADPIPLQAGGFAFTLGGMLAMAAMAFHSLGDFNLQMPGTVWILSALLGLAVCNVHQRKPMCDGCTSPALFSTPIGHGRARPACPEQDFRGNRLSTSGGSCDNGSSIRTSVVSWR
jgi:O-antigen ligase